MSKFFCNGADSECSCPILCADCSSADWTDGTEIKTNADHIRSMTDEELSRHFGGGDICQYIGLYDFAYCENRVNCKGCSIDWLKQPHKEDT